MTTQTRRTEMSDHPDEVARQVILDAALRYDVRAIPPSVMTTAMLKHLTRMLVGIFGQTPEALAATVRTWTDEQAQAGEDGAMLLTGKALSQVMREPREVAIV